MKNIPPKSDRIQDERAMLAVECARSYWEARDQGRKFIYSGGNTFLNGGALNDNSGAGLIDCSTYMFLVLCGIAYEASPYNSGQLYLKCTYGYGDSQMLRSIKSKQQYRYAADLAKYFARFYRCFRDASYLKPGDLTFHSGRYTSRFMSITHIGMVAEDTDYFYNATNVENVVVRSRLSVRNDIVFYARPKYNGRAIWQ